ncbi:MAG: DUF2961 domain-containing protein [Acidobacteriota bacterium]|nr:DUF2961 domain-containing protein [Acidobacteriota bacterium]
MTVRRTLSVLTAALAVAGLAAAFAAAKPAAQDLLRGLGAPQDFSSSRVSSYDRSGGNKDSLTIPPGGTAVLAELKGPAAIHHLWVTIAAEAFYGRKLVLRMYWDGEASPSVEAPIGDFFGVGHGLNRNLSSLPITNSSEGRARNAYWYMPFAKSARVTVTNEGRREVPAFYYYIDYRRLPALAEGTPAFHVQYRQDFPPAAGKNYLILDAEGRGHYVGCHLSVLQRGLGWWGEGDDMIFIDGESAPSLNGTGSEDYFSDAWGMRESSGLFYGCPLQEEDFQAGSKASVYRFHIPDPIPFRKSIRVTIEHGHANDRSDYDSSTAYWYQAEPHKPFPAFPAVEARLPLALEPPSDFVLPAWRKGGATDADLYENEDGSVKLKAGKLVSSLTSYYGPNGDRYPVLATDGARPGHEVELAFGVDIEDVYDLDLYLLRGQACGDFEITGCVTGATRAKMEPPAFKGYAAEREFAILSLKDLRLAPGMSRLTFQVTGKNDAALGYEIGLIGYRLTPAHRKFLTEWNLAGPFDAPDMDALAVGGPPEAESDLSAAFIGKDGKPAGWKKIRAGGSGAFDLNALVQPNERVAVYALGWVKAPEAGPACFLLGSDDGARLWINGELVHDNPAYRAVTTDQDKVAVRLKKGWNKVLLKIVQGDGGFGFQARFADPDGKLVWSAEPPGN